MSENVRKKLPSWLWPDMVGTKPRPKVLVWIGRGIHYYFVFGCGWVLLQNLWYVATGTHASYQISPIEPVISIIFVLPFYLIGRGLRRLISGE
jgi:hypothetical protein